MMCVTNHTQPVHLLHLMPNDSQQASIVTWEVENLVLHLQLVTTPTLIVVIITSKFIQECTI